MLPLQLPILQKSSDIVKVMAMQYATAVAVYEQSQTNSAKAISSH